jgi:hypothetical protein
MNKRFVGTIGAFTVALALAVAAAAIAGKPVQVGGNIEAKFNGGFWPKTLAKKELTPISFWITGKVDTRDGIHPPPLKELILEGDKDASFSVKGIPLCRSEPGIESQRMTPDRVRKECRTSLIGQGRMEAEISFYDAKPIPVESELLLLKGGFAGGERSLYLHAYLTIPVPASIVTVVKVKRIDKGRYGLRAVATIPKIAGGSGSITLFRLKLKKGILSAKCPDGRLHARATAVFGSTPPVQLNQTAFRSCTGKVPQQGR